MGRLPGQDDGYAGGGAAGRIGTGSAASLSIKVNLIDVSKRSLTNSKTFSYRIPADERNAESGVVAANQAAERFLDDLTSFISSSIDPVECSR